MNNAKITSLSNEEVFLVSEGSRIRTNNSISSDALYGGSMAGAIFFTGLLFIRGIGTAVALTAFLHP